MPEHLFQPVDHDLRSYMRRATELTLGHLGWDTRPVNAVGLIHHMPLVGADLVLLALEQWTKAFAIPWVFFGEEPILAPEAIERRLLNCLQWMAVDDLGNRYDGFDLSGGGGTAAGYDSTAWFVPALDPRAQSLTITVTNPVDGSAVTDDVVLPS